MPETPLIAPFGFIGELQRGSDVWLRARWYGAGRGSFGGRDAWAGEATRPYSLMPYQYAYSAPTMWTDPSGRCIPPLGYLRQIEPLNCHNLDMAARIWSHPKANAWEKSLALTYVTAWATGHVCALAGTGLLAGAALAALQSGTITTSVTKAAESLFFAMELARRDAVRSVWNLGGSPRGQQIEQQLGQNLPQNYPVIDRWNAATGEAASIKSIDLLDKTYRDAPKVFRLVKGYIDVLAKYKGNTNSNFVKILPSNISSRVLDLGIPPMGARQEQLEALKQLQEYALSQGVKMNIHIIP